MYSLTFDLDKSNKSQKPVAIVKGGKMNGEILYLQEGNTQKSALPKPEISITKYEKDLKGLKPRERVQSFYKLQEALDKGFSPDQFFGADARLKEVYTKIQSDTSASNKVELPMNSFFNILPTTDPEKRDVFYIAGASGSGKSFLARSIAENYRKVWGDERQIYLISKLAEDETLDKAKFIKRINVESFLKDPPTFEEFNSSLVLFDDYDTMEAPLDKIIEKLINDIAIMGRHGLISMLCMTHYLTNYKKTRLLLNECTHIVIYPHGSAFSAISYLLKTNVGMDLKEIKEIKHIGSRWVCFSKNYPPFLVSEHMVKLLN